MLKNSWEKNITMKNNLLSTAALSLLLATSAQALETNIDFTNIVGLVLNLDAYIPIQGDTQYGASFIFQVQF